MQVSIPHPRLGVAARRLFLKDFMSTRVSVPMRHFLGYCIDALPDEFFFAPASSTGKYHPPAVRGDAGLLIHTMGVVTACEHLFRLYEVIDQFERDAILTAACLHDGHKSWANGMWAAGTQKAHGETAARITLERYEEWHPENDPGQKARLMVMDACHYMSRHMVQWAFTPFHFDAQRPGVRILSTADFVTSRVDLVPDVTMP